MSSSSSAWNYSNTVPKVDLNNPDEMIRANGAAEAAQTDRLKAEVEDYAQVVSELRELYEKNNELVQKLQFMNPRKASGPSSRTTTGRSPRNWRNLRRGTTRLSRARCGQPSAMPGSRSSDRSGNPPEPRRTSSGKQMTSATGIMCASTGTCRRL